MCPKPVFAHKRRRSVRGGRSWDCKGGNISSVPAGASEHNNAYTIKPLSIVYSKVVTWLSENGYVCLKMDMCWNSRLDMIRPCFTEARRFSGTIKHGKGNLVVSIWWAPTSMESKIRTTNT